MYSPNTARRRSDISPTVPWLSLIHIFTAPKNGFIYVLDARTGSLVEAKPVAKVSWATSIDLKTGRAIEVPAPADGRRPLTGGHNWWPMSYSPITGLVYLPLHDVKEKPLAPDEFPEEGKLVAWDPRSQSCLLYTSRCV